MQIRNWHHQQERPRPNKPRNYTSDLSEPVEMYQRYHRMV